MSFLVADNLSHKYGDQTALVDFSLRLDRAEIFALVGPDGAGKTTMIRIICGLMAADSGEVTIAGYDLTKNFDKIKADLGYMPQQFSLYPDLSVEENLTFYSAMYGITGAGYRRKRDELYHFSNLAPFAGRRAAALSGGMKQKLALSCALIHDPNLLILDEPTTGVDPLSRRQFWKMLLALKKRGVTILISTPYMDEVARCDRAAFISNGKKLAEGRPAELAAQFTGQIFFADCVPDARLIIELNQIPRLKAARFGAGLHLYLEADDLLERCADDLNRLGVTSDKISRIEASIEDRFIQLMEIKQ